MKQAINNLKGLYFYVQITRHPSENMENEKEKNSLPILVSYLL